MLTCLMSLLGIIRSVSFDRLFWTACLEGSEFELSEQWWHCVVMRLLLFSRYGWMQELRSSSHMPFVSVV